MYFRGQKNERRLVRAFQSYRKNRGPLYKRRRGLCRSSCQHTGQRLTDRIEESLSHTTHEASESCTVSQRVPCEEPLLFCSFGCASARRLQRRVYHRSCSSSATEGLALYCLFCGPRRLLGFPCLVLDLETGGGLTLGGLRWGRSGGQGVDGPARTCKSAWVKNSPCR